MMSETSFSSFLKVDPRSTKISMSTMSTEMISSSILTIFFSDSVENCKKVRRIGEDGTDRQRRRYAHVQIVNVDDMHTCNCDYYICPVTWETSSIKFVELKMMKTSVRLKIFFSSSLRKFFKTCMDFHTGSGVLFEPTHQSRCRLQHTQFTAAPGALKLELLEINLDFDPVDPRSRITWRSKKQVEVKSWSNWVLHTWGLTTRETGIVQIRLDWSINALVNIKNFFQSSDAPTKKIYSYVCIFTSIWSRYCIGLLISEGQIYYNN